MEFRPVNSTAEVEKASSIAARESRQIATIDALVAVQEFTGVEVGIIRDAWVATVRLHRLLRLPENNDPCELDRVANTVVRGYELLRFNLIQYLHKRADEARAGLRNHQAFSSLSADEQNGIMHPIAVALEAATDMHDVEELLTTKAEFEQACEDAHARLEVH